MSLRDVRSTPFGAGRPFAFRSHEGALPTPTQGADMRKRGLKQADGSLQLSGLSERVRDEIVSHRRSEAAIEAGASSLDRLAFALQAQDRRKFVVFGSLRGDVWGYLPRGWTQCPALQLNLDSRLELLPRSSEKEIAVSPGMARRILRGHAS